MTCWRENVSTTEIVYVQQECITLNYSYICFTVFYININNGLVFKWLPWPQPQYGIFCQCATLHLLEICFEQLVQCLLSKDIKVINVCWAIWRIWSTRTTIDWPGELCFIFYFESHRFWFYYSKRLIWFIKKCSLRCLIFGCQTQIES